YCPLESAIANGIVAGFAIWSFVHDCGPFPHSHAPTYVVNGFILIQCVAGLAVCTLLAEKRDEQGNSLICNLELKNIHKNEEAKLNQTIDALRTGLSGSKCRPEARREYGHCPTGTTHEYSGSDSDCKCCDETNSGYEPSGWSPLRTTLRRDLSRSECLDVT